MPETGVLFGASGYNTKIVIFLNGRNHFGSHIFINNRICCCVQRALQFQHESREISCGSAKSIFASHSLNMSKLGQLRFNRVYLAPNRRFRRFYLSGIKYIWG